jgi:hypothetical protein
MSQNWRPETDAEDFFGHQKKQMDVNNRRPVIRRAADLVGPGIGPAAVRITNFNDLLAQYNGFFSAAAGADFAPTSEANYIGWVSSDLEFGGVQIFYNMETAVGYRRIFTRSPADTSTIFWGNWLILTASL